VWAIYGSIVAETKDLKETIAAHSHGPIAARHLTFNNWRITVWFYKWIANGFYGWLFLFWNHFVHTKRGLLPWVVFARTPKNSLRCSLLLLVLASVALPTNFLTSLESLPYYIAFLKFMFGFLSF
jgi:hypothetical protein